MALADASIRAADPRSILRQGYVLALDSDGTVLKNVSSKSAGDSFALKFMDGMWGCMINDVKQDAVGNQDEILKYVNLVRDRAGIKPLEECNPSIAGNYTLMRDAIRRESRIELCSEGQRYFDLCRWLIGVDVLNKDMTRLNLFRTEEDGFYTRMNFNPRYFAEKNYLYPIPNDETKRSDKLVQNPGW